MERNINMDYQTIIGNKLREYRLARNISQRELGKRANVSNSYVHYFENGKFSITLEQLNKLCIGLGIDMFDFLDSCRKEMRKNEGKN